jgi:hypothetical protein
VSGTDSANLTASNRSVVLCDNAVYGNALIRDTSVDKSISAVCSGCDISERSVSDLVSFVCQCK